MRPHVVIVGSGFAGINTAHGLRRADVDVTIVDANNFHTFQPLLYQVATAYLAPEEVGASVRSIFRQHKNVTFRLGEVTGVDWDGRSLRLNDGATLGFDYLVLATGSVANFFGIGGMAEHSWPLYTLSDAVSLRQHLIAQLEDMARHTGNPETTVVVVGGGPTGVETAGALSSMAHDLLGKDFASLHVVLVEAIPRLLGAFSDRSSERALVYLRRRGVDVRLDTSVAKAGSSGVELASGEHIDTTTIVWAAGVSAGTTGSRLALETARRGAVVTGADLQIAGKPGVFAAGDVAVISPAPPDGQPPALAPNAIQGGKHVARQIMHLVHGRGTEPYVYRDKGAMAVLGRGDAVAELPIPAPDAVRKRLPESIAALRFGDVLHGCCGSACTSFI